MGLETIASLAGIGSSLGSLGASLGGLFGGLFGGGGHKTESIYDQSMDAMNAKWWLWGPGNYNWDKYVKTYGQNQAFPKMFEILWDTLGGNTEQAIKDYDSAITDFQDQVSSLPHDLQVQMAPFVKAWQDIGASYLSSSRAAAKDYKTTWDTFDKEFGAIQKEYENNYLAAKARGPFNINIGGATIPLENYKAAREYLEPAGEWSKNRANLAGNSIANILNSNLTGLEGYANYGVTPHQNITSNIAALQQQIPALLLNAEQQRYNVYQEPLKFAESTSLNSPNYTSQSSQNQYSSIPLYLQLGDSAGNLIQDIINSSRTNNSNVTLVPNTSVAQNLSNSGNYSLGNYSIPQMSLY